MTDTLVSPQTLFGRLLAEVIDERWAALAWIRAGKDPRLLRWRALHQRSTRDSAQLTGRVVPAPSDDLMRAMLGASWWRDFDALSVAVNSVSTEIDPLHCYSVNIEAGAARDSLVKEIEALRPAVFVQAVHPLITAIARGEVLVSVFSGVRSLNLPTELVQFRRWGFTHEGVICIGSPGTKRETFEQPRLVRPGQHESAAPPSTPKAAANQYYTADRGGRPATYDWTAFGHELYRWAFRIGDVATRASAVAHMLAWCAKNWERQPEQRTTEREVQGKLPPETPAR